jgi:hypothetical protein
VLTDPAVTARVHETTAQRVLEKNVPTVMAFLVTVSHVHNVENVLQQAVVNVPLMVIVPLVPTALTAQVMQIAASVETVLPLETVPSVENVHPMAIVPSVENDLVTVIVTQLPAVTVHVMETVMVLHEVNVLLTAIVMVPLVEIVLTALQETAPHMVTVVTAMRVQNEVALVVEAPAEHPEESVQAEIVAASPHLVTVMVAQNAQSVLPTGTVHSVVSVLAMATVVPGQIVAVSVRPMVIVHNVETVPVTVIVMAHLVVTAPAMVIVVPVRTVVETVLHTEIVVPVRNVLNAPAMGTDHSVENVLPMETVALVQNAVVIAPLMVSVQNDHALVTEVVDQIAPALPELVAVMSVLAGKSQNLPKNSAWRANYVWFALTTMILGSMMMSPVTSSTRLHATN